MQRQNYFGSSLLSFAILLLSAVLALLWWSQRQSDCIVEITRLESRDSLVRDTVVGPAGYKVLEAHNSEIQKGSRPHPAEDVLEQAVKFVLDKLDKAYTEDFSYVTQTLTLKNTALDTATFTLNGWVLLSVLPEKPITSTPQSVRLAPGASFTFRFMVELPAGFNYDIVDSLNEQNCRPQASPARNVKVHVVTERIPVKRRCNQCREDCEDQLPDQELGSKSSPQTAPLKDDGLDATSRAWVDK